MTDKEAADLMFNYIESDKYEEAAVLCLQMVEKHSEKYEEFK